MKRSLRFVSVRLFLLLVGVMILVFSIHTFFDIRTLSNNLTHEVYSNASNASDLVVRSTRYGMLLNHKEDVHEIIRALGAGPGFVGINIYDKTGEIIFSTDNDAIGTQVDLQAESCVICHESDTPLTSVPATSRMRVYQSNDRERIMGLIQPIRNEQACANASCHAHTPEQTVLGVLDVKMSLASVDARVAGLRDEMIVSAFVMILIIASISGLFIYRVVRRPIRELSHGMSRIASGDLDARVRVTSNDEISLLAHTFNNMASDLKGARDQLRDWTHTLEDRVSAKTSELQDAHSQLIHMEKMASLGKLSASVAHEINNPLFGILMYAKLTLRQLDTLSGDEEAAAEIHKNVSIIQQESSRCGEIVKGLLDFARQTGGSFSEHHLHEIVERTRILLRHHFEMAQITVDIQYGDKDDLLHCDPKQLQQAIIAPCMNAVEAMPEGGTLTIRTRDDNDTLYVEIADTGIGIEKSKLSQIFEPFFTTKEGEAGLGLGLAVTYGIVQRHQGRIDVASQPGQGTTFTIVLPRVPVMDQQEVVS